MFPIAQFNTFVNANRLFTSQSKLLIAVSGGIDSVYLVYLLHAAGYNFAIAHCNFQLRGGEALQDEQFCRELAGQFDVSFFYTRFETANYAQKNKVSVQMAARNLRYQWFEEISQQNGYDVIALAHHQNDTAETMLLNLTRGTGIAGLHGIRPKNGNLVRPLLFMTRGDISSGVKANGIAYREDSSNKSLKYARNKIRHQVIPALKELNPHLEQTFINEAKHFAELEQLLQMRLDGLKEKMVVHKGKEVYLEISAVKKLQPQHLLLYSLLSPYGFSATTVEDIISSLGKHAGRVFKSGSHQLILDRGYLIIGPLKINDINPVELSDKDTSVYFGKYKVSISVSDGRGHISPDNATATVDASKLQYPLRLRKWQQGDSFYPLGMRTHKKLSDFFISKKIPLHQKEEVPLLINGNGDIIWVCGYRVDDRYKITPSTKKISIFELTEL